MLKSLFGRQLPTRHVFLQTTGDMWTHHNFEHTYISTYMSTTTIHNKSQPNSENILFQLCDVVGCYCLSIRFVFSGKLWNNQPTIQPTSFGSLVCLESQFVFVLPETGIFLAKTKFLFFWIRSQIRFLLLVSTGPLGWQAFGHLLRLFSWVAGWPAGLVWLVDQQKYLSWHIFRRSCQINEILASEMCLQQIFADKWREIQTAQKCEIKLASKIA